MMQLRRRLMNQKYELPAGYKMCKYLESTGTQAFNTGWVGKFGDIVVLKIVNSEKYTNNANRIFGAIKNVSGANRRFGFSAIISSLSFEIGLDGYKSTNGVFSFDFNTVYHIIVDFNQSDPSISIDGTKYSLDISPKNIIPSVGNWLFARKNYNSNTFEYWAGKMYTFSVIRDGNKILDYIPALDQSGVPCMYDAVSGNTFYNMGSDEFLYEIA